MNWRPTENQDSKSFDCAYCGNRVASTIGWSATVVEFQYAVPAGAVYVCPHCKHPTYFTRKGRQVPGAVFGSDVSGIEENEIEELYNEARKAYTESCFTAVVLCSRKLLMHLAVSKGAAEGLSFVKYVDYLDTNHFVPPGSRGWVDKIREKGNEANHEITLMTTAEAQDILSFCEMLLKILYEFPSKLK